MSQTIEPCPQKAHTTSSNKFRKIEMILQTLTPSLFNSFLVHTKNIPDCKSNCVLDCAVTVKTSAIFSILLESKVPQY